jgi:hypothetical protein
VYSVKYKNRIPRGRTTNRRIVEVKNYISNSWANRRDIIFTVEYVTNILKN